MCTSSSRPNFRPTSFNVPTWTGPLWSAVMHHRFPIFNRGAVAFRLATAISVQFRPCRRKTWNRKESGYAAERESESDDASSHSRKWRCLIGQRHFLLRRCRKSCVVIGVRYVGGRGRRQDFIRVTSIPNASSSAMRDFRCDTRACSFRDW